MTMEINNILVCNCKEVIKTQMDLALGHIVKNNSFIEKAKENLKRLSKESGKEIVSAEFKLRNTLAEMNKTNQDQEARVCKTCGKKKCIDLYFGECYECTKKHWEKKQVDEE